MTGCIVRAETAGTARKIAREEAGAEGGWLDAELTTCVELTPEGDAGVVMVDFPAD